MLSKVHMKIAFKKWWVATFFPKTVLRLRSHLQPHLSVVLKSDKLACFIHSKCSEVMLFLCEAKQTLKSHRSVDLEVMSSDKVSRMMEL